MRTRLSKWWLMDCPPNQKFARLRGPSEDAVTRQDLQTVSAFQHTITSAARHQRTPEAGERECSERFGPRDKISPCQFNPALVSFLSNLGQSYRQNPTSRMCKSCVVSTVRGHASSSNSCTAEFIQERCRIIPPNQQHQHSKGNAFNHDFVLCICRTCFGQEGGSGVYSCCNLEPACISPAKFRKHEEVHALLPCSIQLRCCGESSSLHREFPKTMRHAM